MRLPLCTTYHRHVLTHTHILWRKNNIYSVNVFNTQAHHTHRVFRLNAPWPQHPSSSTVTSFQMFSKLVGGNRLLLPVLGLCLSFVSTYCSVWAYIRILWNVCFDTLPFFSLFQTYKHTLKTHTMTFWDRNWWLLSRWQVNVTPVLDPPPPPDSPKASLI